MSTPEDPRRALRKLVFSDPSPFLPEDAREVVNEYPSHLGPLTKEERSWLGPKGVAAWEASQAKTEDKKV